MKQKKTEPQAQRRFRTMLIIGQRACGKSTKIKELITQLEKHPQRKIVVVDKEYNPTYNDLPTLHTNNFGHWCNDNRRTDTVRYVEKQGKKSLETLTKYFRFSTRNDVIGVAIVEDFVRYFPVRGKAPDVLTNFYADSKQIRCDVISVCHSVKLVPPEVWGWTDDVLLFKTGESQKIVEQRLESVEARDEILEAFKKVNAKDFPMYTPVYVKLRN